MICLALVACTAGALAGNETGDLPTTKKAAKTHTIKISDKKYTPASLTIKVGETVVWKNTDDHDHTVVAEDKSLKSDNISPDDSFQHAFSKAGKFKYGCKYHPREKGTITVEK